MPDLARYIEGITTVTLTTMTVGLVLALLLVGELRLAPEDRLALFAVTNYAAP